MVFDLLNEEGNLSDATAQSSTLHVHSYSPEEPSFTHYFDKITYNVFAHDDISKRNTDSPTSAHSKCEQAGMKSFLTRHSKYRTNNEQLVNHINNKKLKTDTVAYTDDSKISEQINETKIHPTLREPFNNTTRGRNEINKKHSRTITENTYTQQRTQNIKHGTH